MTASRATIVGLSFSALTFTLLGFSLGSVAQDPPQPQKPLDDLARHKQAKANRLTAFEHLNNANALIQRRLDEVDRFAEAKAAAETAMEAARATHEKAQLQSRLADESSKAYEKGVAPGELESLDGQIHLANSRVKEGERRLKQISDHVALTGFENPDALGQAGLALEEARAELNKAQKNKDVFLLYTKPVNIRRNRALLEEALADEFMARKKLEVATRERNAAKARYELEQPSSEEQEAGALLLKLQAVYNKMVAEPGDIESDQKLRQCISLSLQVRDLLKRADENRAHKRFDDSMKRLDGLTKGETR